MSYAIVLSEKPDRADGVLVILDERSDAESIAGEVRRKGHRVEVRRVFDGAPVRTSPLPVDA